MSKKKNHQRRYESEMNRLDVTYFPVLAASLHWREHNKWFLIKKRKFYFIFLLYFFFFCFGEIGKWKNTYHPRSQILTIFNGCDIWNHDILTQKPFKWLTSTIHSILCLFVQETNGRWKRHRNKFKIHVRISQSGRSLHIIVFTSAKRDFATYTKTEANCPIELNSSRKDTRQRWRRIFYYSISFVYSFLKKNEDHWQVKTVSRYSRVAAFVVVTRLQPPQKRVKLKNILHWQK